MFTAECSDQVFDLQWSSSYKLADCPAGNHDDRFRFSLHYLGSARDDPTIENLITDLSIAPELPDTRATWHRNYTPLAPWVRAHVLKLVMGWNGDQQLVGHFCRQLGQI